MKYHPFPPLGCDLSRLVLGTMVFSLEALDLTFELMEECQFRLQPRPVGRQALCEFLSRHAGQVLSDRV